MELTLQTPQIAGDAPAWGCSQGGESYMVFRVEVCAGHDRLGKISVPVDSAARNIDVDGSQEASLSDEVDLGEFVAHRLIDPSIVPAPLKNDPIRHFGQSKIAEIDLAGCGGGQALISDRIHIGFGEEMDLYLTVVVFAQVQSGSLGEFWETLDATMKVGSFHFSELASVVGEDQVVRLNPHLQALSSKDDCRRHKAKDSFIGNLFSKDSCEFALGQFDRFLFEARNESIDNTLVRLRGVHIHYLLRISVENLLKTSD